MPARRLLKTYAEEVGVTCAACGVEMRPRLQVVVDVAQDPEMEDMARDGALRRLTCPNGHTAGLTLPLMLRRPGREPRLVFYPSAVDPQEVAAELLRMLDMVEVHDLGFATARGAAEACCVAPGELMSDAVQPYESYLKLVGATPGFYARLLAAHDAREQMRDRPDASAAEAAVAAWSAIVEDAGFAGSPVWMQRGALSELAFACDGRFALGHDPDDADRCIEAFAAALAFPIDHAAYGAFLRRNYAMALAKRFDRRGHRRDLDTAIAVLRLAVPELSGAAAADAEGLLASALTARQAMLGASDDGGDLQRMLEAQVERAGSDAERLKAEAGLAMASADTGQRAYDAEGAGRAIARLERAIARVKAASPEKALAQDALGRLRQDRYDAMGDPADLDRAIAAREQAVAWLDEDDRSDDDQAEVSLHNLAYSLRARYARSGRLADLEGASRHVRRALARTPQGRTARPALLDQWGGIAHEFYGRDKDPRWLAEAIRVFRGALDLVEPGDPARMSLAPSLGLCLSEAFELTQDPADIEEAIALLRAAADQPFPSRRSRADALLNLSAALCRRSRSLSDPQDARSAVALLEQARHDVPAGGVDEARIVAALAAAQAEAETDDPRTTASAEIGQALRDACALAAQSPEILLVTARRWLLRSVSRRLWAEGCEAAEAGLEAIGRLTGAQTDRFGRASWLADAQGLSAEAAYVRARQGDLAGAFDALERGRAQLLADAMISDDVDLRSLRAQGCGELADRYAAARRQVERHDITERMLEDLAIKGEDSRPNRSSRGFVDEDPAGFTARMLQSFEDQRDTERAELAAAIDAIRTMPGFEAFLSPRQLDPASDLAASDAGGRLALAYLVVTEAGAMALLCVEGGLQAIWIDQATSDAVAARVSGPGGFHAFQLDQKDAAGLADYLAWAGETFVRPLVQQLGPPAPGAGPLRLVLIPTGPLAMTPLHACPIGGDGACLLDLGGVTYAPSAAVWLRCAARLAQRGAEAAEILVVANPRPQPPEWIELGAAELEASAITALTPGRSLALRRRAATAEAVTDAIGKASHLHFACHGVFDEVHPLRSGLVLAEGRPMRLMQHLFEGSRLDAVRLVVLSACQTGLIDAARLPEESVGLVSAFIEAGAPGVVGSLWPVGDAATALLMARFYAVLFEDGRQVVHPAEALRQAQLWLRDLTVEELRALAEAGEAAVAARTGVERRFALAFAAGGLAECIPQGEGRAFGQPLHWAGFRYHGA